MIRSHGVTLTQQAHNFACTSLTAELLHLFIVPEIEEPQLSHHPRMNEAVMCDEAVAERGLAVVHVRQDADVSGCSRLSLERHHAVHCRHGSVLDTQQLLRYVQVADCYLATRGKKWTGSFFRQTAAHAARHLRDSYVVASDEKCTGAARGQQSGGGGAEWEGGRLPRRGLAALAPRASSGPTPRATLQKWDAEAMDTATVMTTTSAALRTTKAWRS